MILGDVAELKVNAHTTIRTTKIIMLEQLYLQWPLVNIEGVSEMVTSEEVGRETFVEHEQLLYVYERKTKKNII